MINKLTRTHLKNSFQGVSDAVCAETIEKRRGISEIFRGVLKPLQAKRRRNGRKIIFEMGSLCFHYSKF
jgi:hypothetical protein